MDAEDDLRALDTHLGNAARTLANTTDIIRKTGLRPEVNCRRIAEALASIYEVQRDIYARRPELMPDFMQDPRSRSDP